MAHAALAPLSDHARFAHRRSRQFRSHRAMPVRSRRRCFLNVSCPDHRMVPSGCLFVERRRQARPSARRRSAGSARLLRVSQAALWRAPQAGIRDSVAHRMATDSATFKSRFSTTERLVIPNRQSIHLDGVLPAAILRAASFMSARNMLISSARTCAASLSTKSRFSLRAFSRFRSSLMPRSSACRPSSWRTSP